MDPSGVRSNGQLEGPPGANLFIYHLPVLINTNLVNAYVDTLVSINDELKKANNFTLILDGWTDISRNSIYGFMLLYGDSCHAVLDIKDMSATRHDAKLILKTTEEVIKASPITFDSIRAICTDNPSVMISFRRMLAMKYKHIVCLPCGLHVLNLVSKSICKLAVETIKSNLRIINYFTSSSVWFRASLIFQKEQSNVHGCLSTFCETRWFSMCNVCRGIMEYQHFFMQAKAYSQPDKPALPENVRRALNIQHFADNAQLLELLNPVANLIRKLESSSTSLDDIFIGMLRLYTWYDLNMDMGNNQGTDKRYTT
jgi:hypothetical protein